MSGPQTLGAEQIRELLTELGRQLHARGIEAELFLVGGAAMALGYDRSRVTRDLDGVFEPKHEVYTEAAALARKRGLPEGWLNDGVKGLLPDREPPSHGTGGFTAPGIEVGVASAEYLFAMKAMAARVLADGEDLLALARRLGVTTTQAAFGIVERFYSPSRITPKTQFFVEEIIEQLG